MFAFRFALRNVLSRRSSIVIILFIAFAISLLVVSNAVFDGTDSGMEHTFVNSFTGNIVIRPKTEFPMSLFGDETPVTGELSDIPTLVPYADVMEHVKGTKGITRVIPQVTGMAALNFGEENEETYLFGVNASEYVSFMSGIHLLEGRAFDGGERGLMLNEATFNSIKANTEKNLKVGDMIKLVMTNGVSFSIRAVPLTGVYCYEVKNDTLNRIALIDPETLRSLVGMQDISSDVDVDDSQMNLIMDSSADDFDELFSSAEDVAGQETVSLEAGIELKDNAIVPADSTAVSNSWSFIICRTDKNVPVSKIIRSLNDEFRKRDWPVQAIKWRTAAGGSVNYVFYLRVILNVGIILILLTGFIVINNTLIISALGRVCETGTLRAIGASRRFVAVQFLAETGILTVTAGVVGCVLGVFLNSLVSKADIRLDNSLLIQLFGGDHIRTVMTHANIIRCMGISVLLAFMGWLYPVHVALESNPIVAMRGQI